jgi:hypothetical protein
MLAKSDTCECQAIVDVVLHRAMQRLLKLFERLFVDMLKM